MINLVYWGNSFSQYTCTVWSVNDVRKPPETSRHLCGRFSDFSINEKKSETSGFGFPEVSGGFRRFPEVSGGFRRFPEVSGGFRRFPKKT
jgi:hypothetical protein